MDPKETPLKQIRTYQGDVAEALQKQRESLVSIQRAQHLRESALERNESTASHEETRKRRQMFSLFLASLMLIVLGAVGSWYAYNKFTRETLPPVVLGPANRFLAASTEVDLTVTPNTDRSALIETISNAMVNLPAGELRHVVLTKNDLGTDVLLPSSDFLKILSSRAPGQFTRALDPLFMLGALGLNSPQTPASVFLIMKLTSFENAFAGMLMWEKNLNEDLGPLLSSAIISKNLASGTPFGDLADRNKDLRVLSFEGQPVLLYTFFDNQMLIITDTLETMRTLVERLNREKLSR